MPHKTSFICLSKQKIKQLRMKKSIFLMIALAMLTTIALTSCSNDKAVSTSPTLGTLSIDANTHYTGQYATINVAYSDLGEHVYYSSTAKFTYTITGPYGYSYNDSISVADAGGVVPTHFSHHMVKETGCFVIYLIGQSMREYERTCIPAIFVFPYSGNRFIFTPQACPKVSWPFA